MRVKRSAGLQARGAARYLRLAFTMSAKRDAGTPERVRSSRCARLRRVLWYDDVTGDLVEVPPGVVL
jgi:hypothetical protein